jgi:hypothetical protein
MLLEVFDVPLNEMLLLFNLVLEEFILPPQVFHFGFTIPEWLNRGIIILLYIVQCIYTKLILLRFFDKFLFLGSFNLTNGFFVLVLNHPQKRVFISNST